MEMFKRFAFIIHWLVYLWTLIFAYFVSRNYRKDINWDLTDVSEPLAWILLFVPIIIFHLVDYVIRGKFSWNPGLRD